MFKNGFEFLLLLEQQRLGTRRAMYSYVYSQLLFILKH